MTAAKPISLSSCTNDASRLFIGRQPIFDANRTVVAYELLFRNSESNCANIIDGDHATGQTLVNSIIEFGLDQLVGGGRAFVNLTRNFLLNHDQLPELQDRLVLELLEDVQPQADVLAALNEVVAKGYKVALDDFTFREDLLPLVRLAHIIKLELPRIGLDGLAEHVRVLRQYPCLLLAEKVETYAEFAQCKALGIEYFQGYFLSKPETLSAKGLPSNKLAVMQLLAKVQDPDTSLDELESLIGKDVALSYRILRFANWARFLTGTNVDSIRNAILLTGLNQIRAWVSLIVLSRLDDKPPELIRIALYRSRLCELTARELRRPAPEAYATAGMFSTLEALLDKPMDEVLQLLPLNGDLSEALRKHSGPIGQVLACILKAERGDWSDSLALGIRDERIGNIILDAIRWTDENTVVFKSGQAK